MESTRGSDHPDVATRLENSAGRTRTTTRDAEAAKMETRATAIWGKRPYAALAADGGPHGGDRQDLLTQAAPRSLRSLTIRLLEERAA